jgi:cell division protein ZapA
MPDKPALVHVEIFGQTYAIRAGTEPGYVEALAAYVDGQMKEIGRSGGAVDSLRVAVLAALNVADELFQERAKARAGDQGAQQRARALAEELERALRE